jgi:hypothetical protein
MGNDLLTQNPFAVLTFIVAPAILTNAASVLAMSTINRMLRARERMHQLFTESQAGDFTHEAKFLEQVSRVERQGLLLLKALHGIYVAIGAFAAASLVTLIGAGAGQFGSRILMQVIVTLGLLLGFAGVGGLIAGCMNLFKATKLSLVNIREEAKAIRDRQNKPSSEKP